MMARKPPDEESRQTYSQADVVLGYAVASQLQPAEQVILDLHRDTLHEQRFLDIGVGAGRTTVHFAPAAREYLGVDYAEAMIRACTRRFPDRLVGQAFAVMDARALGIAPAAHFDFVLFSFNGIDSLDHDDRLLALREIRRVLRTGGTFCFSSHNLQFLPEWFRPRLSLHPRRMARELRRQVHLRRKNGHLQTLLDGAYTMVYDGGHDFRLRHYYIRPRAQVQQLLNAGYTAVRCFTSDEGRELASDEALDASTAPWIYYLAQR